MLAETPVLKTPYKSNSKELYQMRKDAQNGLLKIEEVYEKAKVHYNSFSKPTKFDYGPYAWCLVDLIKKYGNPPNYNKDFVEKYYNELNKIYIEESDSVLIEQKKYLVNIVKPYYVKARKARELKDNKEYMKSYELYKEIYDEVTQTGNINTETTISYAWAIYRYINMLLDCELVDLNFIKKLLQDYLNLTNTERPSVLHSQILRLAYKISSQDNLQRKIKQDSSNTEAYLRLNSFVKLWGLENFRSEDYEKYITDDNNEISSLASKVIKSVAKEATNKDAHEDIKCILPYLDKLLSIDPDDIWVEYRKINCLLKLQEFDRAQKLALKLVKHKITEYWAWETLGRTYNDDFDVKLSCYCKALMCKSEIKFIYKLKLKFANMLVQINEFSRAKHEVEHILTSIEKEDKEVTQFLQQKWYTNTVAINSNTDFYEANKNKAEELVFIDIPPFKGVLGESFTLKDNPKKKKWKVYFETTPFPIEHIVSSNLLDTCSKVNGAGLLIHAEKNDEDKFRIYKIQERKVTKHWDIFTESLAVVSSIDKKNMHGYISTENFQNCKFKLVEIHKDLELGNVVACYLAKGKNGYVALEVKKSNKQAPSELSKSFSDKKISIVNEFGFTENDYFIPPNIIKQHNLNNADIISGTAIKTYNKKKNTWGWTVISVTH